MIMGIEKKHIKIGIVKMAPPDPMSPNVIPITHKAPYPNNTKSILQSQPPTSYTIRKKTIGQKKTSKPSYCYKGTVAKKTAPFIVSKITNTLCFADYKLSIAKAFLYIILLLEKR